MTVQGKIRNAGAGLETGDHRLRRLHPLKYLWYVAVVWAPLAFF